MSFSQVFPALIVGTVGMYMSGYNEMQVTLGLVALLIAMCCFKYLLG